ncbi:MAG TPA: 8-oxo-dGTP diphosphatase [Patescibacteria group bacterium]|nr:8-oxo-dGTP diphosphatase [Patescibacteria group bacterium]
MCKVIQTLGIICEDGKILLGMKKRGFGEGRWNGFGGKVKKGERLGEALKREFLEETVLTILQCEEVGVINFHFADKPFQPEVHIFRITKYEGEPIESDEMKPEWFDISEIPYDSMWPDDQYWLPLFLKGRKVGGDVYFAKDGSISSHDIHSVEPEHRE